MQGWLFWLGLLQAAPVVATPFTSLERCMQEVHVAASTLTPGTWYPSCDALRERFEVYGEEAKQRLLAVANASNPAERDIAGCLLAGWPAWSPSDLPALKQAISRERGGGWIVRALAKFPVEQAAAVVIPIVEREGGMNQAGFVLGEMMPRALPQVLRRMAHAPGAERDNLARGDEGRWQYHRHGIDIGEAAKRKALVGYPVLGADDRLPGDPGGAQALQGERRILRLHRQNDDVVGRELDLFRIARGTETNQFVAFRRAKAEAGLSQRLELRPARNPHHFGAAERQLGGDHAADGADAVHHELHTRPLRPRRN